MANKASARKARPRIIGSKRGGVIALGLLGGAALTAAGGLIAFLLRDGTKRRPRGAEHPAPDLALDKDRPGADDRAPEVFRPDPTAPVPDSEREGLRPATGPAPTLSADRGEMKLQTGPIESETAQPFG